MRGNRDEKRNRRTKRIDMMRWLGRFFKMSDVLGELLVGILLLGVLAQAALVVCIRRNFVYHGAGLWIGVLLALAGAVHMTWSLDQALGAGSAEAVKKMRIHALLRYGIVLIIFGILMIFNFANPLTAFLGLMTLKFSAYLQPSLHKAAVRLGIREEVQKEVLSPEEVDELIRQEKAGAAEKSGQKAL